MKRNISVILLIVLNTYLLLSQNNSSEYVCGGIVRFDNSKKEIYLSFTGHEFSDGKYHIQKILKKNKVRASFFFTGDFYRSKENGKIIRILRKDGNYLGAHSDKHLLYCDWAKRDSCFVTKDSCIVDLQNNYSEMKKYGIRIKEAKYFMPPYEWYNDSISCWANEFGIQIVNFTSGTSSNADYTVPSMGKKYVTSDTIYNRILRYEKNNKNGLNGFILLLHIGTDPERTDKLYYKLDFLIMELKRRGYRFKTFRDLER